MVARNDPGSSNGEQIDVIWLHSRRTFAAGPIRWGAILRISILVPVLPPANTSGERVGHLHQGFVQEALGGEFTPVDVDDALSRIPQRGSSA